MYLESLHESASQALCECVIESNWECTVKYTERVHLSVIKSVLQSIHGTMEGYSSAMLNSILLYMVYCIVSSAQNPICIILMKSLPGFI
jgi:hypothetical protein